MSAAPTPTPIPTPNATFDYSIGYLAADPVRPRVYATVPSSNSVIVINTTSLSVTNTILVGISPKGLAVSADGSKLWVANSGSTSAAIGVVDLNTLTSLPSLAAPVGPFDIREGGAHRLYLTPNTSSYSNRIMQIDGDTGALQASFGGFEVYRAGFLEITPDRSILFFGNSGLSQSTMEKFNVATVNASLVQQGSFGSGGIGLRISHKGQLIVYPNGGGNVGYSTFEIPTTNINSVNGSFNVGAYPVQATFSNDDRLLYHGTASQGVVKVFDATTFNLVGTIAIGNSPGTGYPYTVRDLVVDRSGRWLFVGTTDDFSSADLRVYDTGRMDPVPAARLGNISTRLRVGQAGNVPVGGFIITGNDPKRVIIRGIGPSLAQFFPGFLADPTLDLYQGNTLLASNDNWKTDQQAEIQATGIPPANDFESAIVRTLAPGAYTAILRGNNNTVGTGLVEVYDLNQSTNSRLGNISTRGFVDTGDNVMIGGLIIPPTFANIKVIVRAIGPSLGVGVQGALQDPTLELYNGSGTTVATNDDWKVSDTGGSQQAEIEATTIPPTDDREAALVRRLAPGNYTAIVRGKNNTTGVALVEAYNLQ